MCVCRFEAEIVSLGTDPVKGPLVGVHFLGWSVKYDEVIALSPEVLAKRFRPKNTHTNGPHVPLVKKKVTQEIDHYYGGSGANRMDVGTPDVRGAVGLRNLGNTSVCNQAIGSQLCISARAEVCRSLFSSLLVAPPVSPSCFMNSTLQCLANTPGLTEYFTFGKYVRFINRTNPLGFKGKIAEEYGAMLGEIWSGKYTVVTPRGLKQVIGEFCPRFSGYAQQDSSEVLAFLLDGLHEDLNRVLNKPATQPVDSNDRLDAVVAAEAWERHLQRNQSIIVDILQGQLKSRLVCPLCARVSITFDPFMTLAVPVPVTTSRELLLTLVSAASSGPGGAEAPALPNAPRTWPIKVGGSIEDAKLELIELINAAPPSAQPTVKPRVATLLVAEVYQHKILKVLANNTQTARIGKQDQIVLYNVPEMGLNVAGEEEKYTTLQCIHVAATKPMIKRFGIPLVLAVPTKEMRAMRMSALRAIVRKALAPWLNQGRGWIEGEDSDERMYNICLMERSADTMIQVLPYSIEGSEEDPVINLLDTCTEHYRRNRINALGMSFALDWSILGNNVSTLSSKLTFPESIPLPAHLEASRAASKSAPRKHGLDLTDCLSAHGKEETLRSTDKWFCSKCKEHVEATKKIDVFRLPNVLVIHLKRFVYDFYRRDKVSCRRKQRAAPCQSLAAHAQRSLASLSVCVCIVLISPSLCFL